MNIELDLSETIETIFSKDQLLHFDWYGYYISGFFIKRENDLIKIEVFFDSSNSNKKNDIVSFNKCYLKRY